MVKSQFATPQEYQQTAAEAEICNNKKEVYAFLCEKLKTLPPPAMTVVAATLLRGDARDHKLKILVFIWTPYIFRYGRTVHSHSTTTVCM